MKAKVEFGTMRLETSLCGTPVPLWRRKWQRYLEFVGGIVSGACPITLYYTGAKKKGVNVAKKIAKWGYKVEVKRERRKKEVVPALPKAGRESSAGPLLGVQPERQHQGDVSVNKQVRPKRHRAKVQRPSGQDDGGDAGQ